MDKYDLMTALNMPFGAIMVFDTGFTRANYARGGYDGTNWQIKSTASLPVGYIELFGTRPLGYGTYQAICDIDGTAQASCDLYFLGFEKWAGWGSSDIVCLKMKGTDCILYNANLGATTETVLAGVDAFTEHTWQIVWSAGNIKVYYDTVEKANVSTNVPSTDLCWFLEISNAVVLNAATTIKQRSFTIL